MHLSHARVPVIGFTAPSGTGKTTLMRYIIGLLNERGLRVGVIKQARDDFDIDQPGKDSFELRKAGIERLLLGSEQQSALMVENPGGEDDPDLNELLLLFDQDDLDLILVEGFSDEIFPKIELFRSAHAKQRRLRYLDDASVIAIASDYPALNASIPVFNIDDSWSIADFILTYIQPELEIINHDSERNSNPV